MSDQAVHKPAPSDLDAAVDGLLAAPGASGGSSAAVVATEPAPGAAPPGVGLASLDAALSEDAALSQISGELRRPARAAGASAAEFAAPEELIAPKPAPLKASANDIERLDEAIATDADRLLAEAQADLPPEPAPRPAPVPIAPIGNKPAPAAAAPRAAAPTPMPPVAQPAGPSAAPPAHEPVAPVAPTPRAVEVVMVERAVQAEPKPAGPSIASILAARLVEPLRPIAELHERLGESARQTIAYCAILTMFCAACAWGMPRFMRAKDLEPVTPGQILYDDTTPAHGIKAPARPHAEQAADSGHGGDAGHGEAKKPSKAKEKKADDHGKSKSSAKKPAKADAHGH